MKKKGQPFKILSDQLREKIRESGKSGGQNFLFVSRKGLASITICNDCSSPVLCKSCAKPLVLYKNKETRPSDRGRLVGPENRVFMCHYCKKKIDPEIKCETCQSWNLKALGVGADLVYEEVKKEFTNTAIFRIDKENSKTAKISKKTMEEFYKTPGAILIGTEMALYYLKDKIENIAVVSLDSLFAIPDFRMNEKIMHLLVELERFSEKSLIVQTRNPEEQVLQQYFLGNMSQFVRSELKAREELSYPPFSTLIKIIYRGSKNNIEKATTYLENLLEGYNPTVFRSFIPKIKNLYALNVVLKIKRNDWALPEIVPNGKLNQNLLSRLMSLPPALAIEVDPDSLL